MNKIQIEDFENLQRIEGDCCNCSKEEKGYKPSIGFQRFFFFFEMEATIFFFHSFSVSKLEVGRIEKNL